MELLRLAISVLESTQSVKVQPSCKKSKTAFHVLLGEEDESSDSNSEAKLNQYFAKKVANRDIQTPHNSGN